MGKVEDNILWVLCFYIEKNAHNPFILLTNANTIFCGCFAYFDKKKVENALLSSASIFVSINHFYPIDKNSINSFHRLVLI